ncbi:MAG: pyridoxamine 5'-phosphate oxidase [Desulfobulbaceae bacterium]|nr:pyridoxamine 5'-phosphate oxidase [Desulfobulbaceae bacterium]
MSIIKKLVIRLLKSSISRYLDEAKLYKATANANPVRQFATWFDLAKQLDPEFANAMVLSTSSSSGQPSSRLVLLKDFDEHGFVFYTNYGSRKSCELADNPQANLVFWWKEVYRQVRVEGRVEKVSRAESEAYFATRVRGSQIGAWASRQSSTLEHRADLQKKIDAYEKKFKGQEVPCPPFWGGFRLLPHAIEFWQGRENRLHDRLRYLRTDFGTWEIERLSP